MAGNTVGANDAFVFKVCENVHLLAQFFGPFGGLDAVQQDQIDVIGSQFPEKSLNDDVRVWPLFFGNAAGTPPDFADDHVIIARNAFERRQQVRMGAVEVGKVEDADAAVIASFDQFLEFLFAKPRLVRLAIAAMGASAQANAAEFQFGLSELNPLVRFVQARFGFRGV